ncbi:hypothetical protein KAU40_00560 [Candidatus Parcubacteria bacterium]|nr:hypothetical protein [Candidatus Parcubacteria bacterium]
MKNFNQNLCFDPFIKELEKEWKKSLPIYSGIELLQIFPEVRPYLKKKLKEMEIKAHKLSQIIYLDFLRVQKKYNGFNLWFFKQIIKTWKGEELDKMIKEISKIKLVLFPLKKTRGKITKQQIEKARQVSFERFIEVKKNFALCPFHSEKKGSFYIKNGFAYCFACCWHGDIIKFIQETKGFSFVETVKFLT